MKKIAVTVASIAIMGMGTGVSQAEICYQLEPFIDILRIDQLINSDQTGANHTIVWGQWNAANTYDLPFSGAYEWTLGRTNHHYGLSAVNENLGFFGGNQICALVGIPAGAWSLTCVGTATPFVNSGSPLKYVGCPNAVDSYSAPVGKSAGQK